MSVRQRDDVNDIHVVVSIVPCIDYAVHNYNDEEIETTSMIFM